MLSSGPYLTAILQQACINNINKQQKFYSLPKRYEKIRRFEQRLFGGNYTKRQICLYRLGSE
jgi:hypothetical protein